jgi:hypothetical protein
MGGPREPAGVVEIRSAGDADEDWLRDLQEEHWGGQFQVANGEP